MSDELQQELKAAINEAPTSFFMSLERAFNEQNYPTLANAEIGKAVRDLLQARRQKRD